MDTRYERIINSIYHEDKDFDPVTTECIDSLKEEIKHLIRDRSAMMARISLEYKNKIGELEGELEKESAEYDRKIDENISILERVRHAKHI